MTHRFLTKVTGGKSCGARSQNDKLSLSAYFYSQQSYYRFFPTKSAWDISPTRNILSKN